MSKEDRAHWDRSHGRRSHDAAEPSTFLAENAALLPPGRTLDLAAGSGRNAVFLASRGHRVLAADVSQVALEAIRGRDPWIDLVAVDLDAPCFQPASFDNIVCVSFLDRRLFPSFVEWLRPGGVLLYDTFLVDQRDVGHPRNPDFLLERNELLERLRGEHVLRYREGAVAEAAGISYRASIVAVRVGGKD